MRPARFAIARPDGRSNAQVLIDYVKDGEPGRIYTYEELSIALSHGADHTYSTQDVRAIVTTAYPRILKEHQRALHNIRGQGYRVAFAKEHTALAMTRKRRSDTQLLRGFQTLQHVRIDELDPNARMAHEGTLMIVGGLYQAQQAMDKRLRAVEDAIRSLK